MSRSEDSGVSEDLEKPKSKRHRRDKPWDDETIDHWKTEKYVPIENQRPFIEESSFAVLFPKYREKYLREVWPQITTELQKYGIGCQLDLIEGSMAVKTTRKTLDPYVLFKSRDLIKLLARSVPFQDACKVLDDSLASEIIKIGNIVRTKERFIKRRQRLIGPNGATLKAIQLLTECYMLVQGNTIAVIGPYKGLKQVRKIVLDCMNNIHPVYHIKQLMIKKELAKDETLKNESWDRFLPNFKKQNIKKKKAKIQKKEYTPFPPPQQPRKIDLEMESGEYFLKLEEKRSRELAKKKEAQKLKTDLRRGEREKGYIPPEESTITTKNQEQNPELSIQNLKEKLKKEARKRSQHDRDTKENIEDYVYTNKKKKTKIPS